MHPSRRPLFRFGDHVAGYFLDDRADLVAWLLALEALRTETPGAIFAATVSEEVGGEGAQYLMHELRPEVCIALELGPTTPDAPVEISDRPTLWTADGYANMSAADAELVLGVGREIGVELQVQALSRGGSDASCSAARGLCARPITIGLPMQNSHGFEIMHVRAMDELTRLVVALVRRLA